MTWHTDNDSTAVKQTDVNDGAVMQPQDSSASEAESEWQSQWLWDIDRLCDSL